jgi:hypothetical protein
MTNAQIRAKLRKLAELLRDATVVANELQFMRDFDAPISFDHENTSGHIDIARLHLAALMSHYYIKCGDKDPLNYHEELCFDSLNNHLRLPKEAFDQLTHEQKFSAARVIIRQGCGVNHAALTDHLGIKFNHIYIGIEKDGYAHS